MEEPGRSETRELAGVASVLGGTAALGKLPRTASELASRVRDGLPFAALVAVMSRFEIPQDIACRILNLSRRNFPRRKQQHRLAADESDRLYRLARILAHANRVFEDSADSAQWLRTPNPALAKQQPLGLLDTDIGVRQVEEILGRIEYGIVG